MSKVRSLGCALALLLGPFLWADDSYTLELVVGGTTGITVYAGKVFVLVGDHSADAHFGYLSVETSHVESGFPLVLGKSCIGEYSSKLAQFKLDGLELKATYVSAASARELVFSREHSPQSSPCRPADCGTTKLYSELAASLDWLSSPDYLARKANGGAFSLKSSYLDAGCVNCGLSGALAGRMVLDEGVVYSTSLAKNSNGGVGVFQFGYLRGGDLVEVGEPLALARAVSIALKVRGVVSFYGTPLDCSSGGCQDRTRFELRVSGIPGSVVRIFIESSRGDCRAIGEDYKLHYSLLDMMPIYQPTIDGGASDALCSPVEYAKP